MGDISSSRWYCCACTSSKLFVVFDSNERYLAEEESPIKKEEGGECIPSSQEPAKHIHS